ncbi:hypothetical protein EV1_041657 [Malus domestica]
MYNIDQLPNFGSRLDPVQFGEPLNRVRTSIFACAVVRCYFHLFSPFIFAASFYYLMLAFVIMEKIGSSLSLSCGYNLYTYDIYFVS